MYRVLWLLKRKPGITHEAFREHYERSHVRLAHQYIGHLLTGYRRFYKQESWGGGVPTDAGDGFGPIEWSHDCVTEWVMRSEADFEAINAIFADPVIGKYFHDDEEHFLDRKAVVLIKTDVADTGTGDGAGTLALGRQIGAV